MSNRLVNPLSRSNRADFILHLCLALFMVLLIATHFTLVQYFGFFTNEWHKAGWAWGAMLASVWMLWRMLRHCLEAIGREVDQQHRRRRLDAELREALDRGMDQIMYARPYSKPPRTIIRNGKAA